ncbi:UbiA family prenyltransferase [Aquimarina sp. RZ0]|uniref:UbiA family prenyltransferase n=1 Tax=Aquimarina sp. RZ0 TaxID=2607730 RepID=UPI0011F22FD7|nr:UbiA family prenyltransferase [Aquimarina sp. RZ0]KAA1243612.1 hypothetical protein F0000_20230 [Aquimarina sp. RZ0]
MKPSELSIHVYSPLSLGFIRSYVTHMRPYLLFVSGIAGYAGMALSFSVSISESIRLVVCLIAFFLGYGFGQALTDCFQIDTDSISSPYRPLVRGIVKKGHVMAISIIGLIAIGVPLILFNIYNLPIFLLSALGLITYTFFKKNVTLMGPFWNSWIVMLLPIAGYLSCSNTLSINTIVSDTSILVLAIMTFASYANFVLIGYLKDISADRETGYKTFPVVYGWIKSMWMGNVNVFVSIVAGGLLISQQYTLIGMLTFILGSLIAIRGQIYGLLTLDRTEENSAIPVASTVRSFILWHLAIIFSFQSSVAVFISGVVFYLLFELVIYNRPQKEQI